MTEPARSPHAPSRAAQIILLAVVVLVGLNLRPFLTGIGPLAGRIAADTGLSLSGLAWLTLLPMLLMGVGAFLGPAILGRLGARSAILGSLVLLALGSLLRLIATDGLSLIATAALCGIGVAVIQAIFPGVIKERFPLHVAATTGLYSASLMGGGAFGAQATPIIAEWTGNWHSALAWLAVPTIAAFALAFVALPRGKREVRRLTPATAFLRYPRTWLLMICFGLINGGYASLVAWLAPYYQSLGLSETASGSLVAVMSIAQAAAALTVPMLAASRLDRRPWLLITLTMQAIGFLALAYWPNFHPVLWIIISGAGLGGSFALCLIVGLDHLPDPEQAGTLSAVMQGGCFLLTSLAPWGTAILHQHTGTFVTGWLAHLTCVIIVGVLALRLHPKGYRDAIPLSAKPAAMAAEAG